MTQLKWSKVQRGGVATTQRERWEAAHGTTTLAAWQSVEDGSWGYEIREQTADVEQVETGGAASLQEAEDAAEARARDRNLLR